MAHPRCQQSNGRRTAVSPLAGELEGRCVWRRLAPPAAALFCFFLHEPALKGLKRVSIPAEMWKLSWLMWLCLSCQPEGRGALEALEQNLHDVLVLFRHDLCFCDLVKLLSRLLETGSVFARPRPRAWFQLSSEESLFVRCL